MNKRITYVVLGVFLILTGLMSFIPGLAELGFVAAILALIAGALILFSRPGISNTIAWVLAALYLILLGLKDISGLSFQGMDTVIAILALAAGILFLIRAPRFKHHIGFFLFCVWLFLVGLMGLFGLGQLSLVVSIVAAASGLLMILNE
jgi:hypothetical protein